MLNQFKIHIFFLVLLGINLPVFSQTIHSELRSLSESADVIITGKVTEQKSEWNADRTRIFTMVTLAVEDVLKGTAFQNKIIITHPGGEIGEVGEVYSHVPRFFDDESVLLFLKRDKDNVSYKVLEGEAGKISLTVDKLTGEKVTSDRKYVSAYKKEIRSYVEQQ